jgi:hypothetical protein
MLACRRDSLCYPLPVMALVLAVQSIFRHRKFGKKIPMGTATSPLSQLEDTLRDLSPYVSMPDLERTKPGRT